jgi:type II secretory pathway component PulF
MKCLRRRKFWAHRFSQMSYFRYHAIAPTGEFAAGEVEVPSRQEVVRRSERLGPTTTPAPARSSVFGSRTQRHREMTAFLRQLAVLVGGGLTLEAALQAPRHDTGEALAWPPRNLDVSPGTSAAVGLGAWSAWNPPWALGIGEQTSELALIARHTTQFCEHKFGIGLGRLVLAAAALTTTFVGAVIGMLIVSSMGTPLSNPELAT